MVVKTHWPLFCHRFDETEFEKLELYCELEKESSVESNTLLKKEKGKGKEKDKGKRRNDKSSS